MHVQLKEIGKIKKGEIGGKEEQKKEEEERRRRDGNPACPSYLLLIFNVFL